MILVEGGKMKDFRMSVPIFRDKAAYHKRFTVLDDPRLSDRLY
jgi:hypothetical protein